MRRATRVLPQSIRRATFYYYYEVEPLGVYLVEIITGSNIRFYYQSGEDLEKVR